jgi:hypothetical protein
VLLRLAKQLWKNAVPRLWTNSLSALVALKRLGFEGDVRGGVQRAAEIIDLPKPDPGLVLPANSPDPSQVVVRTVLCPDVLAAVEHNEELVWCSKANAKCKWAGAYDEPTNSLACGTVYKVAQAAKWYQFDGGNQIKAPDEELDDEELWGLLPYSNLTTLLAVLGPVAWQAWKGHQDKRKGADINNEERAAASLVKSILKAEGLAFSWDNKRKRVNLLRKRVWIAVRPDGKLFIKNPDRGGFKRVLKKDRVDELFKLTKLLKEGDQ